ncbi:MAG: hypothetical protein ACI81L_002852 [Verrucomicrobiales bacterium]|jgi:hypothetical protein
MESCPRARLSLLATMVSPAGASSRGRDRDRGFTTSEAPFLSLANGLPRGSSLTAIISSGDEIGDFMFEGLPDGVGARPREVSPAVPRATALGDQDVLEAWSNDNNVMPFIRLEDVAVDKKNSRKVYIADHGRIFEMVMNEDDPRIVDSLTILADGDVAPDSPAYVPFVNPDNLDTSKKSLMVQEDADNARIWQLNLRNGRSRVVGTVNDIDGESSGIVDASEWFGRGAWLLTVQAHSTFIDEELDGDVMVKREAGQLLLMRVPGT